MDTVFPYVGCIIASSPGLPRLFVAASMKRLGRPGDEARVYTLRGHIFPLLGVYTLLRGHILGAVYIHCVNIKILNLGCMFISVTIIIYSCSQPLNVPGNKATANHNHVSRDYNDWC